METIAFFFFVSLFMSLAEVLLAFLTIMYDGYGEILANRTRKGGKKKSTNLFDIAEGFDRIWL